MPLLFSIQGARSLEPGENLCAFLDDIYLLCERDRVKPLYNILGESVSVESRRHRTRASRGIGARSVELWHRGVGNPVGRSPVRVDVDGGTNCRRTQAVGGDPVRLADSPPKCEPEVKPHDQNIAALSVSRVRSSARRWHLGHSASSAQGSSWIRARLELRKTGGDLPHAHRRAGVAVRVPVCPCRELGLVVGCPSHDVAELVVKVVNQEERPELQDAAAQLEHEGFWWRPSWEALRGGERPPQIDAGEPGEWPHGWQFGASSVSDTVCPAVIPDGCSSSSSQVTFRTQRWRNFGVCPNSCRIRYRSPHLFRVLVLERLHLILLQRWLSAAVAEIHSATTGRRENKKGEEEPLRPNVFCFREAGARVRFNAFLRDMNVGVLADDTRRIEVLAQDLPCLAGLSTSLCAVC